MSVFDESFFDINNLVAASRLTLSGEGAQSGEAAGY